MNSKITFGQYYFGNSIIHKIDPRTKIFALLFLMIGIFLIPYPKDNLWIPFILLGIYTLFFFVVILLTKVPLSKYLKSLKQVAFLLVFALLFQLIFNKDSNPPFFELDLNFSYLNIIFVVIVIFLALLVQKYIKTKLLLLLVTIGVSLVLLHYPVVTSFGVYHLAFYQSGVVVGSFILFRVFLVLALSTILTLTTKPTDLTNALEWYLHPLELLHVKTSILAMILSIALRYIPTLFNETSKILKAQASRGADFNESSLKKQVTQMISLLIPMFIISIQRAEDLADAMEARGYNPDGKRTKLVKMEFHGKDIVSCILILVIFGVALASRWIV